MRKLEDRLFGGVIRLLCLITVLLLGFLVVFILRESLPAIRSVGLGELLLGSDWRPIIYQDAPSYGLRNMIVSTLFVSALAVLLALGVGVGCALFLACGATERQRMFITPCIELLASIPSVVYGFVGLYMVVKFLEKCGRASGESVLAAGPPRPWGCPGGIWPASWCCPPPGGASSSAPPCPWAGPWGRPWR